MEKAGFGSRFVALIIDNVMIGVIALVVTIVVGPIIGLTGSTDFGVLDVLAGLLGLMLAAVLFLLQFLYFAYLWSKSGQSIGMRMMGIRVITRDLADSPSFLVAGLRGSVGYMISGLFFSLGFIWAAFDANGEAWHDKLFNTRVVTA